MSEIITFPLPGGPNFTIPDVGDENWGQSVTDYLVALPLGVPPTSGTFTLTGDLYFGASFGLVSEYFKSPTINPASAGLVRLAKTDAIEWRNNANSGNLSLAVNGSDQLTFNGTIIPTSTGNLTDTGTDGIAVTGGTGAVIGSGTMISQHVADSSHNGYLSSSDWTLFNSAVGGGISQLTGDVTATGPGSVPATLATVNSNVGSFTSANITVNGKGLITAASNGTTINSGTTNYLAYYSGPTVIDASSFLINSGTGEMTVTQLDVTNRIELSGAPHHSFIQSASIATTDRIWMVPDLAADATFAALEGTQTFSGNKTFSATLTMSGAIVAMGSNKITGLANGTSATDAAAFGQVQYAFQTAIQGRDTTSTTSSGTSYTATNTSASITPTSTSSRIKITVTGTITSSVAVNQSTVTIFRNGATDLSGTSNGFANLVAQSATTAPVSISYIDSPGTTSSTTYQVYISSSISGDAIWNNATGAAIIILEELR